MGLIAHFVGGASEDIPQPVRAGCALATFKVAAPGYRTRPLLSVRVIDVSLLDVVVNVKNQVSTTAIFARTETPGSYGDGRA